MTQHLFLSPHFDDAIGSCGGTIWRLKSLGHAVRVLTAFGGVECEPFSMPARILHHEWGLARPVRSRRLEDASACGVLECVSLYLEFQDAIYRQDTEGGHLYRTFESLRGSIAREDQALAGHLASQLSGYLTDNSTVVYCPMAIGGHVDHVLARNCGRILKAHNTCVVYYRDFFYDQTWSGAVEDDEIAPAPLNVRLTNQELSKKVAAFSEYKSQISDLFNSKTGLASYFAGTGSNEAIFLPRQTSPAHLAMLFSVLK